MIPDSRCRLPNLVIPGAAKAGTSSLCEYLGQHPDIFVPPEKEPRYFVADTIRDLPEADPIKSHLVSSSTLTQEAYLRLYAGRQERVLVDASVQYLYHHADVIPHIRKLLGDPVIIICLRNPVDRAFSNFMYTAGAGETFEQAIAREGEKISAGVNSFYLYVSQGYYYAPVKAYMDAFSRVKVVLTEDMARDSDLVVAECFALLGLRPWDVATKVIYNRSGRPRNKLVEYLVFRDNVIKRVLRPLLHQSVGKSRMHRLGQELRSRLRVKRAEDKVAVEQRQMLIDLYRDDVDRLQALVGRDLSGWFKVR